MYYRSIYVIIVVLLFSKTTYCQPFLYPKDNPVELGKVRWLRDYDEALQQSKEKNLPIFILFQEVPGCANCTKFGNSIISHPLIVEAIETCFVPLCIYNNKGGKDKVILEKFNEPSWNNPVVRIINHQEKDIVKRQADFRNISKTVATIINALQSSGKEVDEYLQLLLQETSAIAENKTDEVYFSMYCFWTGEREIAALDGVLATEAGFMHGKEVVKVTYDKDRTSIDVLADKAKNKGCADQIYAPVNTNTKLNVLPLAKYKKDHEDKYYLLKSPYKSIPMTELQKTKVNRAIAKGQDASLYLSPRQLAILANKNANKNYTEFKMEDVWYQ
ncbi:MAG TPA: VPGUxxT family thioredoxin-like (seleno)protein, type 2 [Saprospiraceae bacterium]|nr:VPGUxxT family thioredoxin-like (seleno)protein, type 2 [Saprospiraceae bacterium]